MDALEIIGVGTPILVLLSLLSVGSITLILVKARQLLRASGHRDQTDHVLSTISSKGARAAREALGVPRTPAGRLIACGLNVSEKCTTQTLENKLEILGTIETQSLFRHIRTLETIAMVSPLLGLLGTVLGMIQAFRQLELAEGAANAGLLAGGIWQALLTTAAGLIVALPAAAGAALLAARAENLAVEMENTVRHLLAQELTK